MKKKLLAFDIDGTLLNSEKRPLESTLVALKRLREAGHFITIATGRNYLLAEKIIKELAFDNYILSNGAIAFVADQQVYSNPLDKDELNRLIQYADDQKLEIVYQGIMGNKRRSQHLAGRVDRAMKSFGGPIPEWEPDFYQKQDIYQALAFYTEEERAQYEGKFSAFRFVRWHSEAVDILPVNGSKAHTIQLLADKYHFKNEDIVTFGDGDNDKEMLKMAGTGVVMGNASDDVKAMGDYITSSNDQDGIWQAVQALKII